MIWMYIVLSVALGIWIGFEWGTHYVNKRCAEAFAQGYKKGTKVREGFYELMQEVK